MALNKQVFLYSIDTSAFYNEEENKIHHDLLKLYNLRKELKNEKPIKEINNLGIKNDWDFWRKTINKLIEDDKKKLVELLEKRLEDSSPRILNEKNIKDKNIVALFDSALTRALGLKINELTEDLFILNVYFFQIFHNLVRDGFIFKNEKYIYLTSSAGQIRKKMGVFIKESRFREIEMELMCGLTREKINEKGGINTNKFLAYLALNNSATDVWENFDIDRSIVVEDWEGNVDGVVDSINEIDYSIERKEMPVFIPHMDGCGIMLEDKTRMVRLPWIKGLLVKFPFDKFIKEKKCDGIVYDIYGKEHDILKENIKYIFTKSQFKLCSYYNSWEEYKEYFKKYNCQACYCNEEEDNIQSAKINYQMLQTLSDIKDEEIERITKKTIEEINKIGCDFQTTMRVLGATENNLTPNYFQQALMIYPELFRDVYHKEILKQTKKSLIKQAKGGRLVVRGRYQFLSPDLYAFCEWLFLNCQNPKGLLKNGEVYSKLNRNNAELACLRSPHLYREWAIRRNNRSEELDKWFGSTNCVYTSCHDLITKIVQADCDGDKLLVIQDRTLTAVAKRNMKDIVPLNYPLRKAKGGLVTQESIFNGMINAFTGGNIGPISNNITKVWNSGMITQEQLNVVKWLCQENNQVIDYAKTLWKGERPKDIDKVIKSYTKAKVPNFFIYAKDKDVSMVEDINNSTMNRISAIIPTNRIKYNKALNKFDYQMLMNHDSDFTIRRTPILDEYDYWQKHWKSLASLDDEHLDQDDLWAFKKVREKLLNLGDKDYVINTLIVYSYTVKKNSTKKLLWACFGKEMVENLKINTINLGKICPICGKRFKPFHSGDIDVYCSQECYAIGKKEYDREYRRKSCNY